MASMATALTFGIQTDTDKYNYMTPLDVEALRFLLKFTDRTTLRGITSMPPSPETLLYYNKAKENEVVYKDWAFYGIGYIDNLNRDTIAIAADMILKNSEHKAVAVFALIENLKKGEMYLDVSLRSNNRSLDLNKLIKRNTPDGGGRKYKGAYQVKMNYFLNAPDKDALWSVVEATTIEALRKSRDTLYITGIEGIFDNVRDRIVSFLKKDSE